MITFDFSFYWQCVGAVSICLAGYWGIRRAKSAFFR